MKTRLASGLIATTFLGSCGSGGGPSGPPGSPPIDPGSMATGQGVNLIVDAQALQGSVQLDQQDFQASDCAVVEGCVGGPGTRRLLRFDGDIINAGHGDLVLGNPGINPNFHFDTCHMHYHLENIMEYALLDANTGAVVSVNQTSVVGRKQGFCLKDSDPYDPSAATDPKYDCSYQGIQAGWEDEYDASLDCQWLDITGVPPGTYILRLTVNPDHTYLETDYSDNTAETLVVID